MGGKKKELNFVFFFNNLICVELILFFKMKIQYD